MANVEALLTQILSRLDKIERKVGKGGGGDDAEEGGVPESVSAFDEYCTARLDPFKAACDKLGGDAAEVGVLLANAWKEARSFILMASQSKEPTQAAMMPLLAGVSGNLSAISKAVKRNEWDRHVKAMSEAASCLNILAIKNPPPMDFIKSQIGSSMFHSNKIRVEFRASSATPNPDQIAFCETLNALMDDLIPYVKEYHRTGLTWNKNGVDATAPPPAPAATPAANPSSSAASSAPTKVDLAAALSKGGAGATAGLKHVDKKEVAAEKAVKTAPSGGNRPAPKSKAAEVPKGEPKCEKVSVMGAQKWQVEYQSGLCEVKPTSNKETVYIYGCIGAGIDVQGDCRNITIEQCKNTRVFFNSVLATCEIVNSKKAYVNIRGKCPSLSIDNTDGATIFISQDSLDGKIEFTTSKSSEMNLQWEKGEDIIEKPIPEQYKHTIANGAVTVAVSDLYA